MLAAAVNGHVKMVELLLAAKAKPNTRSPWNKYTALDAATRNGHTAVVELLLATTVDVSPQVVNNALRLAEYRGYGDTEELLRRVQGAISVSHLYLTITKSDTHSRASQTPQIAGEGESEDTDGSEDKDEDSINGGESGEEIQVIECQPEGGSDHTDDEYASEDEDEDWDDGDEESYTRYSTL